ncbi:MAG: hypothetical protein EBS38_07975, partial [Actinobacteria bacterium]|nr:hypothetical protein [Actinomycetota bacterium]
MSTKTTLKRIALVAVSALGFGLMSVAPSNAAVQSDALTLASTTSSTTVGSAVTNAVSLTFIDTDSGAETATATVALVSSPVTSSAMPTLSITSAQATANTAGTTSVSNLVMSLASTGAGRFTGSATISLTPTVAGTYVIRVTPAGGLTTTAQTWTVTVDSALTVTAANSTSFIVAGETSTATADATISVPMTFSADQRATIVVTPRTAGDLAPVSAVALTATISGPGTLGIGGAASNTAVTAISSTGRAITGTAGDYWVGVFSDGTAGVATITISAGTTVLATETVTFFGAATRITPTVVNAVIPASNSGAAVGAITAIVTDAAGVPVSGVRVYDVSSATTIISDNYGDCGLSDATGKVTCNLTGVAAGTASITLTTNSAATVTTGISAAPVSIRVGSASPATVALSFDKATYVPGERATVTVTLRDSLGLPVVNGTY